MTTEDRKVLLSRIQASLNLGAKDTDGIIGHSDTPEELRHRLLREFRKLNWFERFFLSIKAFLTSKTDVDVMAERKLFDSRQAIAEQIPGFVQWSRAEWSAEFAKALYDLYVESVAVKPIFEHLFLQKITLEASLAPLIQAEYSDAATGLEDLFPRSEILELYRKEGRAAALYSELARRVDAYWDEIPGSVFDRARDQLRPLYFMKALAFYPYAFLFELFKHSLERGATTKYPPFSGAAWKRCGPLLERLYYGLYLASKIETVDGILPELCARTAAHLSNDKEVWSTEQVQGAIVAFHRAATHLSSAVPWRDVLRWSFQDPYYSVKFRLPQFSVADFYQSTLEMTMREELDERLPVFRQELLSEERSLLFRNEDFAPLEHYIPGVGTSLSSDSRAQGFRHTESLNILWAFLSSHFPLHIVPFFQSLSRLAPPQQRTSLQGLSQTVGDLANLRGVIAQFDRGLDPDAKDGKELSRLRYELGNRSLSQKPFFDLIQLKDDQALEILQRGTGLVDELLDQLNGLRERNVPALRSLLKLPYVLEGQQESVENGLGRVLAVLEKLRFVLKEALNLEE